MVSIWLTTEFSGGRHARRVSKITEVENKWIERNSYEE
jgi:ribose 5-phosphate isomerase RpiB